MGASKSVVKSNLQTYTHQILSDGTLATQKEAERRRKEAELIQQRFEQYQQKKKEEEEKCEIYNFFANIGQKNQSKQNKKKLKSKKKKSPNKKQSKSNSPKKITSNSKKSKKTEKSPNKKKQESKSITQNSKKGVDNKENNNQNIKQEQQKNNLQKFLDKERDLHMFSLPSQSQDIQSVDQFDESILSDDENDIQNFLHAFEQRQKYDITNNDINKVLNDINIQDLDIDEEVEQMFQREIIKEKPKNRSSFYKVQQQDIQFDDCQNECFLISFLKFLVNYKIKQIVSKPKLKTFQFIAELFKKFHSRKNKISKHNLIKFQIISILQRQLIQSKSRFLIILNSKNNFLIIQSKNNNKIQLKTRNFQFSQQFYIRIAKQNKK